MLEKITVTRVTVTRSIRFEYFFLFQRAKEMLCNLMYIMYNVIMRHATHRYTVPAMPELHKEEPKSYRYQSGFPGDSFVPCCILE